MSRFTEYLVDIPEDTRIFLKVLYLIKLQESTYWQNIALDQVTSDRTRIKNTESFNTAIVNDVSGKVEALIVNQIPCNFYICFNNTKKIKIDNELINKLPLSNRDKSIFRNFLRKIRKFINHEESFLNR